MRDEVFDSRGPPPPSLSSQQPLGPTAQELYLRILEPEVLHAAYTEVKQHAERLRLDPKAFQEIERKGLQRYLGGLAEELKSNPYRPAKGRHHIVQAALAIVLQRVLPPAGTGAHDADEAVRWVARNIERGLSRIYADSVVPSAEALPDGELVHELRRHIGEGQLVSLFKAMLAAAPHAADRLLLAPVLLGIRYQGIERILEQAKAIGRHELVSHVEARRFGNDFVVLADGDRHYDWVLPAAEARLLEGLAKLKFEVNAKTSQVVNLAKGESLRFLGFDLRAAPDGKGTLRVLCQASKRAGPGKPSGRPRRHFRWKERSAAVRASLLASPRRALNAVAKLVPRRNWLGIARVRDGWRALAVGDRLRRLVRPALVFLTSDWRQLPWAGVRTVQHLIRRWDLVLLACVVLGAGVGAWQLWPESPQETAMPGDVPGLFLGRFVPSRDSTPIEYNLYLPDEVRKDGGPYPLVVTLNPLGQGLAAALRDHLKKRGRFELPVFSLRSERIWQTPANLDDAMELIDHVIQHHRMDRTRVYLLGHGYRGDLLWRLAARYPDRWAALAVADVWLPFDVHGVPSIPCRLLRGENDRRFPLAAAQKLVRDLKEHGGPVSYTEYPGGTNGVALRAYSSTELFDWLGKQALPAAP